MVVSNPSMLYVYDLERPEAPQSSLNIDSPDHLSMCTYVQSTVIVYSVDGNVQAQSLFGDVISGSHETISGVTNMVCSGSEIAFVTEDAPMTVNVIQLGVSGQVGYDINATAPAEEDEVLSTWGTPVDMENASVQSIAFDREYLAVTVDWV